MIDIAKPAAPIVQFWLYTIALMVMLMVLIGGLTRLTDSGLSMVDWNPIMGAVPPLDQQDWETAFQQYKQYPEYKLRNMGMSLSEFKFIFMMEYIHRLMGRLIGLVFFLPFIFFLYKKWLGKKAIWQGILLFVLGGLQGFAGWYMVKSGLVDIPRVSPYRLTLHLGLAIGILSLCLWYAWDLKNHFNPGQGGNFKHLVTPAWGLLILIGLQITGGGFVAGLKAGFMFNTFPTMNGAWVPPSLWTLSPWYLNFLQNPVAVQFIHRWMAVLVGAAVIFFWIRTTRKPDHEPLHWNLHLLGTLVIVQILLGVTTLLTVVAVPLAAAHQVVAVLLWSAMLMICHKVSRQH